MKISDKEKNEIINYVKAGKYLPEKYKFLIFEEQDDVSLTWLEKEFKITNVNLPFQSIEHVDTPRSEENVSLQKDLFDFSGRQLKGWTNKLIWGDNKLILSSLRNGQLYEEIQNQGGLKLVYIDPPFDVGAKFYMPITIGKHDLIKSPSVLEEVAYDDTWGKGLNSFNQMIYERLYLIKNLMSDDGSIYVHCDWRVNSYMRIILDEIFGKENFKNEIIWSYRIQGVGKKFWARKHDSIYFYTKSDKYTFYPEKEKNIYEKPFIDTQKEKSKIEDLSKKQKEDILKKISNNQSIDPKYKNYIFDTYFNEVYVRDVWDSDSTKPLISGAKEYLKYPTQKPEGLLKRIIKASSNEGDLIADFFVGSGTSISVAEQMNRKWIGTDLSKYSIHTSRKRLIETQRKLKSDGKSYRAFEVLNLGKYERQYFMKNFNKDLSISEKIKNNNFKKFKKLVIEAYNAKFSEGYQNFDAVKNNSLIHIGPVDYPVTREDILRIIEESKQNKIRSVHILAFDYEMGLFPAMINQAKDFGITIEAKKIPQDVFDPRAIENNSIKFYDVSYVEAKLNYKKDTVSVELTKYSPNYSQENTSIILDKLREGQTKKIIENSNVVEITKKNGQITRKPLIKNWTDWIDYWSVDFDYESKIEVVKTNTDGKETFQHTGNYIFENEWQDFIYRTKGEDKIMIKTPYYQIRKKNIKIAIRVIDIFANDTMIIKEINK
tara:strand:+ start:233 stop:2377 length:2145 start_codon:yes stop_codon:yes gene_type:complete